MNNEMCNGMNNSWIKTQLEELKQDKIKEQDYTIATLTESIKEDLNEIKTSLLQLVKLIDRKLGIEETQDYTCEKYLKSIENKIQDEEKHILKVLENKYNSIEICTLCLELIDLIVNCKYKKLSKFLNEYNIQSNLPYLLEQYNEFKEHGCKQMER